MSYNPSASPFDFSGLDTGSTYSPFTAGSAPDFGMGALGGFGFGPGASPGGPAGWFGIQGLGANMPTIGLGLDGLKSIGGLYSSLGALGVAKQQLSLSKMIANRNLANQTASYNTSIADRARSRGAVEGQTPAMVADYIKKNSLTGG